MRHVIWPLLLKASASVVWKTSRSGGRLSSVFYSESMMVTLPSLSLSLSLSLGLLDVMPCRRVTTLGAILQFPVKVHRPGSLV